MPPMIHLMTDKIHCKHITDGNTPAIVSVRQDFQGMFTVTTEVDGLVFEATSWDSPHDAYEDTIQELSVHIAELREQMDDIYDEFRGTSFH